MKFKRNISKHIEYRLAGLFTLMLLVFLTPAKANVSDEFSFKQDSIEPCKVELANLIGNYQGGCKNGFANGQGEAFGIHHYKGGFKKWVA